MTKLHTIDYYMDTWRTIPFCKICSAEGDLLAEDCSGLAPCTAHYRMARYLDLCPNKPETWPINILDRLICIEQEEGFEALIKEIRSLMKSS